MKKFQNGFFTNLITIIVIILLGVGVYVYLHDRSIIDQTISSSPNIVSSLTLEQVLNSNGFSNGQKGSSQIGIQTILKNQAIIGDLDDDSVNEVIVPVQGCGASCGTEVSIFKLDANTGLVTEIQLPETFVSGALANIDSIQIKGGILIVVKSQSGDRTTYQFKMREGKMWEI